MYLRTRILLGYWYLVGLVVVSAAAAALGFLGLGSNVGRILDENFESVPASTVMLEALERQDSAMLTALLGEEGGQRLLRESEAGFEEALQRARSNITFDEEAPVLDEIERRYAAYRSARDRLLSEPRGNLLRAYERDAFPSFAAVKAKVFELLELNHRSMVDADLQARHAARLGAMGYGMLVLIALLSLAVLSQALGRLVLDRLEDLGAVARAVAGGDHQRRATAVHHDELGEVAGQLNSVMDRLAELEGSFQGLLAQERDAMLGLLAAFDRPAVVLSLGGALAASTLPAAAGDQAERIAEHLPAASPDSLPPRFTVEVDDSRFDVQLLRADGVRPVGWLAMPVLPAEQPSDHSTISRRRGF